MNATCTACGSALQIIADVSHPYVRVLGQPQALYFCDHLCRRAWDKAHCAYCGRTPRTTTLTVRVAGGTRGSEPRYCDVGCLRKHTAKQ